MSAVLNSCVEEYLAFVEDRRFPCIAAKAALAEEQIRTLVVDHLGCPKDDQKILDFLYQFVNEFRIADNLYHSAAIIFQGPNNIDEVMFDRMMWQRLQSISDLDALHYSWDTRVSNDSSSPDFSYSIKSEAMYVIGLHPNSSRVARRFHYPALVFNPHQQFIKLRRLNKYAPMKEAVRKRDLKLSGSVNPMLHDFGESTEAFQYSGKIYEEIWKCPFVSKHGSSTNDTAS
jgi:FPC/CPF motif-containing protein YcgG